MTTEIEGVKELLDQIDPNSEFGDLEWEIVDNDERTVSASKYLDDRVTKALLAALEGEKKATVKVKGHTRADKYRRWANANNLKLNVRHPSDKVTFLWVEKRESEEDKKD